MSAVAPALDAFIAWEQLPIQTCVQVDLLTPQQRLKCACPEVATARTCYDLRYYGRTPVNRGRNAYYDSLDWISGRPEPDWLDDDECDCSCHEDDDYDDGEDWA